MNRKREEKGILCEINLNSKAMWWWWRNFPGSDYLYTLGPCPFWSCPEFDEIKLLHVGQQFKPMLKIWRYFWLFIFNFGALETPLRSKFRVSGKSSDHVEPLETSKYKNTVNIIITLALKKNHLQDKEVYIVKKGVCFTFQ